MTMLRRLAFGVPLALVASVLPVMRSTEPPRLRDWLISVPTSGLIRAPGEFGLLGVSWGAAAPPRGVSVRTSASGTTWTSWHRLEIEADAGPDPGTGEHGSRSTQPIWVGRARFVDVRFTGVRPPSARVHLIDPGSDRAPAASSASASPAQPTVISRAQWGADESIRRGSTEYADRVKFAVLHHTATTNSYSPSESARIVRSIYTYHVKTNGWNDIGYNLLVDRFGQVFEGRRGGIDRAVVGAHAAGFNTGSTGVSMIGTFTSSSVPGSGLDALRRLLAWKLDVHHIDARATTRVVSGGSNRYPSGTSVTLSTIATHRDVGQTECPGDRLVAELGALRESVRSMGLPKIYDPVFTRSAFTPNGDGRADDVSLSARIDGASSWVARIKDAAGTVVRTRTGTSTTVSFPWDGRNNAGEVTRHGKYAFEVEATAVGGAKARPARVEVLLAAWPDGSVLKGSGSAVYRMRSGRLQHFRSRPELLSHYRSKEVAEVPDAAIAAYPTSGAPGFREGTLLRTPDRRVWLVSGGTRRHIRSAGDFDRLGLKRENVIDVSQAQADVNREGTAVDGQSPTLPNGMVARGTLTGPVYWIQSAQRRHIPSRNVLTTWLRIEEVAVVSETMLAGHSPGTTIGFRDGTLVKAADGAKVWVISSGRRRHIPSGATLNALGFARDNIRVATAAELALHPEGSPV